MSVAEGNRSPDNGRGPDISRSRLPFLSLLFLRIATLAVLPFEASVAYGDFRHFFEMARLSVEGGGMPFIGHWIEFPPLFPYFSIAIERLTGGQFHSYGYLLAILMLLLDAANLWVFSKLAYRMAGHMHANRMVWLYMVFLAIPGFGWWTFEPMSVFFMLLGLWLVLDRKPLQAGLITGLGFLTKIFPIISLAVAWRFRPRRAAILATVVAVVLSLGVLGTLLAVSPTMASASLRSQISKGSWETIWALIDGNLGTGTFGPAEYRLDPEYAIRGVGNPAVVPLWIPTILAGLLVIWVFVKTEAKKEANAIPFLVTIWSILLLWSRGWSPQWVAYLVPLILLCFALPRAVVFAGSLVMVSILEWPILLSRGYLGMLWLPVVIRTLIIFLMGFEAGRISLGHQDRQLSRS